MVLSFLGAHDVISIMELNFVAGILRPVRRSTLVVPGGGFLGGVAMSGAVSLLALAPIAKLNWLRKFAVVVATIPENLNKIWVGCGG